MQEVNLEDFKSNFPEEHYLKYTMNRGNNVLDKHRVEVINFLLVIYMCIKRYNMSGVLKYYNLIYYERFPSASVFCVCCCCSLFVV